MTNSTFANNHADGATNGGAGGAIFTYSSVYATNSTFVGNHADGAAGNGGIGGAIGTNGVALVTHGTFTDNHADGTANAGFGGGVSGSDSNNNNLLKNSIFVGNTANGGTPGTSGDISATNYNPGTTNNLYTQASAAPPNSTQVGAFAFATPLQNNGSPTQTLAISANSAAYDAGDLATCQALSVPNSAGDDGKLRPARRGAGGGKRRGQRGVLGGGIRAGSAHGDIERAIERHGGPGSDAHGDAVHAHHADNRPHRRCAVRGWQHDDCGLHGATGDARWYGGAHRHLHHERARRRHARAHRELRPGRQCDLCVGWAIGGGHAHGHERGCRDARCATRDARARAYGGDETERATERATQRRPDGWRVAATAATLKRVRGFHEPEDEQKARRTREVEREPGALVAAMVTRDRGTACSRVHGGALRVRREPESQRGRCQDRAKARLF